MFYFDYLVRKESLLILHAIGRRRDIHRFALISIEDTVPEGCLRPFDFCQISRISCYVESGTQQVNCVIFETKGCFKIIRLLRHTLRS